MIMYFLVKYEIYKWKNVIIMKWNFNIIGYFYLNIIRIVKWIF